MFKRALNAAVGRLIQKVEIQVLDKRKTTDDNEVVLKRGAEFLCGIFDKFHPNKWFDNWTLMVIIQISNKSFFVRYGYNVSLDNFERARNNKIKRVSRPLAA